MLEAHRASLHPEASVPIENDPARIATIRKDMRFAIGAFHEPIDASIGTEAFLPISFTMASAYAGHDASTPFFWNSPTLAAIGLALAAMAWPGVATSYKIIVEWNRLFMDALKAGNAASTIRWRPSVFTSMATDIQAHHRRTMLFSRFVPAIFVGAGIVPASR